MRPANIPERKFRVRLRLAAVSLIFLMSVLALSLSGPTARAAPPTLTIVSPADGTIVANGTPLIVHFLVSNFAVVQPGRVGQIVVPNEGHLRVFVDEHLERLLIQVEPIVLPLSSGPHTIRLQLVGNDGVPLSPDVSASVRVVATHGPAGGVPKISIISPKADERTGHGVYISFQVSNFILVEPHGQPNAPNEGHIQILVQILAQANVMEELVQYEPAFLVTLPDGDLTLTVRLVNNDGTPLNPDVSATIPFHVTASSQATLPIVLNGGVLFLEVFVLIILLLRRRKAAARNLKGPSEDL